MKAIKNYAKDECRKFEKKYGYSFSDNEISIKGKDIVCVQGNRKMGMLSADDIDNFTIGIKTGSDLRFGRVCESCVYKYTSDPFAAAIVFKEEDKEVGSCFVWVDKEKDTFVFDSMTFVGNYNMSDFSDIIAAYVEALPYSNVQISTGYNMVVYNYGEELGFDGKEKTIAEMPTTKDSSPVYSDYHYDRGAVARELKHNGVCLISAKENVVVNNVDKIVEDFENKGVKNGEQSRLR